MRCSIFLGLAYFMVACHPAKRVDNYTVTRYQKVADDFQYSNDLFRFQGNTYRPFISSGYIADTLATVGVFKSEGRITYNKQDLEADTPFKKMLGLPERRQIEIDGTSLTDDGRMYRVTSIKEDSIFCMSGDTLMLYHLK